MKGVFRTSVDKADFKYTLIIITALLFFVGAVYLSTNVMVENRYQKAVARLKEEKWEEAALILSHMPNHKDGEILKRYALARDEMEFKSQPELVETGYVTVLRLLYEIPDHYQGDFKEDIDRLKVLVLAKREQAIKEGAVQPHFLYFDDSSVQKVYAVRLGDKDLFYERSYLVPNFEVLD
ncbi:hypothetical protein [Desulfofalx alkaliphila]|uniref:hypothetical protein n=1 Tax=Desulfofalx alkaliphila TaxID=105483 RepID=UPI0004E21C27|nr:hypothetical protein [Desulfofalx alkaliphila]